MKAIRFVAQTMATLTNYEEKPSAVALKQHITF